MSFKKSSSLSTLAIYFVALTCILVDLSLKNYEKQDRVIEWDVHSYYAYLPAYFIYDDIKLEKSEYRFDNNYYMFWPSFTDDGKKLIKTSLGVSIMYAPFFFVAHAFALVTDYPEDGFSEPYKIFLLISTIFYLILGFDFLKKILTQYNFSDKHIAIVVLLIGLGTNMLCYASQSAPMTHVYSFCLFAIFIYYAIKWYKVPSVITTILLGLLLGLITLVRPTNVVIIIVFALYNIASVTEFQERSRLFIKKYVLLCIMAFCAFLVWIPQFTYWKTVTGHFLSYSYGDERFFFNHPRILEGLFGWRKGWLVYTPMMAFALIGLFFLKDELKKWRLPIVVFMVVNTYIIFSWWCWWYGGTMGQRCFIESYALLAIPLSSFIKFLAEKKWYYNALFYFTAAFLIWLNIFQTYQFEYHSLHYDGMTKALYFKQFGKLDKIPEFDSLAQRTNYDEAKKGNSCDIIPADNTTQTAVQRPVYDSSKKEIGRKTIQLKAANGKYVCADGGLNNTVIANRDSARGWETFTLTLFEKNECVLLTYNNMFFCVEMDRQNEITATRNNAANWATFTIVELESDFVAFKAANGKYLSVDEKSSRLFANGETIGKDEKFELRSVESRK